MNRYPPGGDLDRDRRHGRAAPGRRTLRVLAVQREERERVAEHATAGRADGPLGEVLEAGVIERRARRHEARLRTSDGTRRILAATHQHVLRIAVAVTEAGVVPGPQRP